MNGSITISKSSHDVVCIRFREDRSSIRFLDVEMSLSDFANAVFGLAECPCKFDHVPTASEAERLGWDLESRTEFCDKVSYIKDEQREHVKEAAKQFPDWELSDDGTRSQQPGDKHRFTLRRWVKPKGGAE